MANEKLSLLKISLETINSLVLPFAWQITAKVVAVILTIDVYSIFELHSCAAEKRPSLVKGASFY